MPADEIATPKPDKKQNNTNASQHWFDPYFWLLVITAIATSLAAVYTRKQYLVSEDMEGRQLRAYVGFVPGGIENFGDKQKQVFRMTRKNYGSTPAYNVFAPQTVHDVLRISANLPATFSTQSPNVTNTGTLFPTMENRLNIVGHQMSQTQIDLARAGIEYNFVYYGIVYYTDAFGAPHYTRYCWLFKGESMTDKDADACLGHNDSD